ncbi:MAG: GH3 auxin-responsive promoter family protein [Saprospiraceae bacterium]|nr:GH3 auxin-responsive promoter family protein [Saprospiraceae bacterium]MDW8484080.1 GH3 auxin-responsive promoter family protein [Saprospiraceae bacterium]
MKRWLNAGIKYYLRWRMRRVEQFMRDPEPAQWRWFCRLITSARYTEFGRRHGLARVRTVDSFRAHVPVHDYEALKGDIARMMRGERDVLWPGEVCWFSKSSGTTSDRSKFIPIPRSNLIQGHLAGIYDSLALLYANCPHLEAFVYRNLYMPGSFSPLPEYPKCRVGDVSAILAYHAPIIANAFQIPDLKTALMPDFEQKIERTAEIASQCRDIVTFNGVPTWLLVLFRRVLEKTKKSNLLEVWPRLQAYMHGGVGFEPYRQTFQQLIPSESFVYQEIYNASEGYFGAQCDLRRNEMLLLLDNGVFYEFIPMSEWDKDQPRTVLLQEVELGKDYAIVITSNNGLWRYVPGDTVVFTSKYPFCFQISGRTKQYINAFGEEVMVSDTDKAIAEACRQTGALVAEYTAAPVFFANERSRGGHEWVIEFEKAPPDLMQFNRLLDESLQRINSDYEAKRYRNLALECLRLHPVPRGTFLRWMKARGKFGSQNKVPRLANHRQYVEELLQYAAKQEA